MSPDLLAFLFLVTSTALVLGVAVTLRGLWGLVGDLSPRLPESSLGDASGIDAGSSTSPATTSDEAPAPSGPLAAGVSAAATSAAGVSASPAVRDMRESLVMTIGGVFIVAGALIALATLVHSA
jgi:hypothetical protein